MDNFIFLEPLTPSSSQPPRLPGVTSSNISRPSLASLSDRQTTSQFNQRNDFLKSQPTKSRDVSDVSKKSQSDQRCRNYIIQDQDLTTQTSPNSDDDDDFPSIEELLSDTLQKNSLVSADPNGVDAGFVDIDDVLSGTQQKGMLLSANLNSGGIAVLVDNGTRGGSPTDSSCSNAGSSRDPIILSDDESMSAESETDYSNLEVDLTAKSDSSSLHIAERDMVSGEGFGFGTTFISDCFVADHQDDSNDSDSGVADGARLQLAGLLRSASPGHESVTQQASPIRVNTEITQGDASYDSLDVTKETQDEGIDVLANDEDGAGTYSTTRSGSSAISSDNPTPDSHVSLPDLQNDQHDSTQSPKPCPAAASYHQSDLTNDLPPKHRRRRDDTKNVRRKRVHMPSLIRSPRTASPVSAALESNDFKHTQSVALLAAPVKEREIHDIDHRMVDDGGTDDSNDEDYDDMSGHAASEIRLPLRPRKQVKRAKDIEHNDVEIPSTPSLSVSCQATAATSSVSMQESEEIPIHRYLTLKTIDSKVVYCLTFSQELLSEPSGTSQRQGIPKSVSSSRDKRDIERLPVQEQATSRPARNSRFSSEDDELLLQLKGKGLSWDEISDRFPERSKGTLQVHYSTKLKPRSETLKNAKKSPRSG